MRRLNQIFANFSEEFLINSTDLDPGGYYCDPFHSYLKLLHTYYIPIIIAVGFVGNFLSCVVFLSTHLKMRSSSYYLAALAIADFGFLCVVLVVHCSFNNVFEIYNSDGWCQFFVYLSSVCASLSVWLIVAFTVERFIAVQYPLQRPHICTVSRAKTVVISLTAVAMLSQLYLFWIAGVINNHDGKHPECEMKPAYFEFMKVINFVDTMATLIVPFVLIVTMNTMIARNLFLFRRRLQASSIDEYLDTDTDKTELQHSNVQSGCSNRRQGSQQSHVSQKSNPSRSSKKYNNNQLERCPCIHIKMSARNIASTRSQQNITKMLLLISSVFIALNFPSYVTRLSVYFVFTLQQKNPPETLYCIQQFAMLLYYTNFSINFLLYAMCGVTFRRCLWQLLRNNLKRLASTPFHNK
ncbi:thyrotropin-releasing hormone receptor [Tribolium madens]|uniref:thyrotropin-releasing hormone receptor n=1 Tax=Tribolium madens TaxID=41895 RepID=UPI001CF7244C|nr:thyrotropin-releasing hormone receptor [Tribolium madens]